MVSSKATSVAQYLKALPPERRAVVSKVRAVIRKNLPKGYQETMNWGMICYEIPLATFRYTYNKQPLGVAALAAQKHFYAVYLFGVHSDPAEVRRFREEYKATGKKLDMGVSCVRFKSLDDLPLDLIGRTIASAPMDKVIEMYKRAFEQRKNPKGAAVSGSSTRRRSTS